VHHPSYLAWVFLFAVCTLIPSGPSGASGERAPSRVRPTLVRLGMLDIVKAVGERARGSDGVGDVTGGGEWFSGSFLSGQLYQ
jgi:hypothetical protein